MPLRDKKKDVPATSQPLLCKVNIASDDEPKQPCGELATEVFMSTVEIMGKKIPLKVPMCGPHYQIAEWEVETDG